MKRCTGILVALLMFTLGISKFVPERDCVFNQLMVANKVYHIYSDYYPEYNYEERQCRFTGMLPNKSLRVPETGKIEVSCSDIDFPEVKEESCPADNLSSITINVYAEPSHNRYDKYSTHSKCGFGRMDSTYRTERIDIDWNSKKTRGRFACTMIAKYRPNTNFRQSFIHPNQFHVNPPPGSRCVCGRENVPKENHIVPKFGYEAGMNQYPFMAALVQYKGFNNKFYCGASIISQRYALSSAQCKHYNDQEEGEKGILRLRVGDHNNKIDYETNQSTTYEIEWMKEHEKWSFATRFFDDIMLIKTRAFIKYGYGVGPVCLPYFGDSSYTPEQLKILGWGSNSKKEYPDILKEIRTNVTDNCYLDGMYEIKDRLLCTQATKANRFDPYYGTCNADTGDPLIGKDSNGNMLLGILTYQGCAHDEIDVFTRVTRYLLWINTTSKGDIYC